MEHRHSSRSCRLCSLFTIEDHIQALSERRPVTLFLSYESLNLWASNSCPFSQMLQPLQEATAGEFDAIVERMLIDGYGLTLFPPGYDQTTALQAVATRRERLRTASERGQIRIQFQREDDNESSDLRLLSIYINDQRLGYFAVCTVQGDPAEMYIGGKPVDPNPASELNIDIVRLWILHCIANHKMCPGYRGVDPVLPPSILPTRVIDVSQTNDPYNPKLYISHGERAIYTALTYCWGGPQPFATTTVSINSYIQRIPMESLPKTIQDAITLTRRLAIRYLWVDSLCIIQDSAEDKAREITKMAQIYKNSLVTISAASAHNCHEGFLGVQESVQSRLANAIQLPYRCPNGMLGNILLYLSRSFDKDTMISLPINKRAWTYQEQLLSPRVVSYEPDGIQWKCPSILYSNDGLKHEELRLSQTMMNRTGHLPPEFFKSENKRQTGCVRSLSLKKVFPGIHKKRFVELHEEWFKVVKEYSSGKLSLPDDKLPAIAGIAAEFQRLLGDTYLAGLWKGNLIEGLNWITIGNIDREVTTPNMYRSPSWSWVSVHGLISFLPTGLQILTRIQIISCKITLVSDFAPFGQVSGAYLTLRGPLKSAYCNRIGEIFDGTGPKYPSRNKIGFLIQDGRREIFNNRPDDGEEVQHASDDTLLWFLKMCNAGEMFESTGLVLVRGEEGTFERVGYFVVNLKSDVNTAEERLRIKQWSSSDGYKMQTITIL